MGARMPKFGLLLLLQIVMLSFVLSHKTYAQGVSLSIYPPVIEVQTTPPSSPTSPIIIQNNNEEDVELTINLIPLKSNNRSGEVILDPNLLNSGFYGYYKNRIQFLVDNKKVESITLDALESKEVIINLNVEKGDPPGDYYYAIVFLAEGSDFDQTSISQIPAGIATNLLISIEPKGQTSGGIAEFKTDFFKTKGPVDFSLKVHNASKHLVSPTGKIKIRNIFGQTVGIVDILPQYVLANSDRYLVDDKQASNSAQTTYYLDEPKVVWPEKFLLGLYNATVEISLDESGKTIDSKVTFVAFPLYLTFPLIILIFVILSVVLKVKRKV